MSRWFRHYAGMMRDEKLVRAALRAKQPIERVVWVWGAILESAAEIDDGGRYEIDRAEMAYFLRIDEGDIGAIEDALDFLGRVRQGLVGKWGERQFQSDRSAERTKRYRERQREQDESGTPQSDDVTTSCDANVTSQQRHGDAPETETETEKKIVQIENLNKPETLDEPKSPSEPKVPRNSRKDSGADPTFIEFYSAYPRHQSKQDAIKAYQQARKAGVSHETIMRGLDRAKRSDSRFREMKFTPLPASWLRAGGYEDEPNAQSNDWKMAVFS